MAHLNRKDRKRLEILKTWLSGWDFKVEPWFTIPEEDAKIILRAIDQYEKSLERRKRLRLKQMEKK